ncbi:ABC transporter permease [Rhizosphaericola mali]|uniref:FtsX-like permease family protein n=1 Tax=Rhizosphaericola mali TaxID=2545455 RepID=A0A5P2G793_9BACT|nr:ABC transporter permease [Rhizosphaericola mali]QES89093.1 FtsX-like permease family protein [Rhizosphaericola mali]
MFKNYFKTAIRSLLRNKGYATLNILGLAIGMASTILIVLWVMNEITVDNNYEKSNRLYILNSRGELNGTLTAWNWTPEVLATTIKKSYPEVENVSRVSQTQNLIGLNEHKISASGYYVDSSFLNMFNFPISGDVDNSLNAANRIVLSSQLAIQLFGKEDPVGKVVKVNNYDPFIVSAVLDIQKVNTSFKFAYLLPMSYYEAKYGTDYGWANNSGQTYMTLKQGDNVDVFNAKIKDIEKSHTRHGAEPINNEIFAYPFSKFYLYGRNDNGNYVAGHVITVRMFSIIASLILLIACINFMNLSTARSEKRAKEVGVRKVVGASKATIILQFLLESIIISFVSFVIGLGIIVAVLPFFNSLIDKQLLIPFKSIYFWLINVAFIVFTGLLAGSYPAFFLSAFNPVKILKGAFRYSKNKISARSVLVIVQFTFAIILIISTIVIAGQMSHLQKRDQGYKQDALVYTNMIGDISRNYPLIRNALLASNAVTSVSKTMSPITTQYGDIMGWSWDGSTSEDKKIDFGTFGVDADLEKTFGLKILEGRSIDIYHFPSDSNAVLLNQTAVKTMRLKNPIGTLLRIDKQTWKVIGVVQNFIIKSPNEKIEPMMIQGPNTWFDCVHYRLNSTRSTEENLKVIATIFKKYNPSYPFEYTFVDTDYARKFEDIQRISKLTSLFSGLTIFISCLGLFGLAAYMAEARTKEIGVRKVLGASIGGIATLLSKDFLKLVVIALLLAVPIAWYAMHQWLIGYQYRINVPIWAFFLAGFLSIIIAILTVGILAIRAARANPTKSLRTE